MGDWFGAVSADQVTTYDIHGAYSRADSHDELWVFDHEHLPVTGELSPYDAALWAKVIGEVEECQRPALCAWVLTGDYVAQGNGDLPSISDFEERYAGEWKDFADYAEQLAEDIGLLSNIPEEISRYFDWEAWTRDLRFDHMTADAPGGGHIRIQEPVMALPVKSLRICFQGPHPHMCQRAYIVFPDLSPRKIYFCAEHGPLSIADITYGSALPTTIDPCEEETSQAVLRTETPTAQPWKGNIMSAESSARAYAGDFHWWEGNEELADDQAHLQDLIALNKATAELIANLHEYI